MSRFQFRLNQLEETERARMEAQYAKLVQEFCQLLTNSQKQEMLRTLRESYPQLETWSDRQWQQIESSAPLCEMQHNIRVVQGWLAALRQGDFASVLEWSQASQF